MALNPDRLARIEAALARMEAKLSFLIEVLADEDASEDPELTLDGEIIPPDRDPLGPL
ncbi:hypothetical protein [Achromobacter pestifer]